MSLPSAETTIRLTQHARGAGCGCKIAPGVLDSILEKVPAGVVDPRLLVGYSSRDDAAVYDLGDGRALISTTDFFTPIVDDAFDFGRVAAVNAISDVYAMGGTPLMAIGILGWPVEKLPAELAAKVLEGARTICDEAGIPLAGGHSIDAPEPFFGLALTGEVRTHRIKRNNTAREGDLLLLTKPLGLGIMATALKRGRLVPAHDRIALDIMCASNRAGSDLGEIEGVHAMTDVTGFGLLGHLLEMCDGSGLGAGIMFEKVPLIGEARQYLADGCYPDGTFRNWKSYGGRVQGADAMEVMMMLSDPQTSGGLLIAVHPMSLDAVSSVLGHHKIPTIVIGDLTSARDPSSTIRVFTTEPG